MDLYLKVSECGSWSISVLHGKVSSMVESWKCFGQNAVDSLLFIP